MLTITDGIIADTVLSPNARPSGRDETGLLNAFL